MSGNPHPLPTLRDWLMLAIGVVFVAMGLIILPHDRDLGITTLAFFGSCLAVFIAIIVRKLRYAKFTAAHVEVIGGVPIRPKKALMVGMGLWLLALGLVLIAFTSKAPLLISCLYGFMAAAGAVLLAGALLGRIPGGHLQFDPGHFTIASRNWSARIPWNSIVAIDEGDYHNNPVLMVSIADLDRVEIEPPSARSQAMTAIAKTQTWMGAEFVIMTMHYGIDLPVLAATVTRYVSDVSARAELGTRLL